MATAFHRSRAFRVSSSILLSAAFFVTAIGVALIQGGKTNISADTTTGGGTASLVCGTTNPSGPITQSFDSTTNGQTANLPFGVATQGAATIIAQSTAGKSGNGILLTNTSSDSGYDNFAELYHYTESASTGTISFDVRPHQTTGSFAALLFGPTGGTGTIAEIVFNYDGTVGYLDYSHGGAITQIAGLTYQANIWQHVTINWVSSGVNVTIDGQTTGLAPYVYTNTDTDGSVRYPPINLFGIIAGYGDGTHAAGSYDIDNVTYPGCQDTASTDAVIVKGTSLTCAATDPGKQATDNFDSLTDGQTDFGYTTIANSNTSIAISKTAGKSGNGIKIIDNNAETTANVYGGLTGVGRKIAGKSTGAVEADVNLQPGSGNQALTIVVGSGQGAIFYTYMQDGKFMYWNKDISGGYTPISTTASYTEGTWYHIKLDWTTAGFNFYVDGTKINSSVLTGTAGAPSFDFAKFPPTDFSFGTPPNADIAPVGTYYIDNVNYPSCADQTAQTTVKATLSVDKSSYAIGSTVTYTITNNASVPIGVEPADFSPGSTPCYNANGAYFPTLEQGTTKLPINFPTGVCSSTEQRVVQPGASLTGTWDQKQLITGTGANATSSRTQVAPGAYSMAVTAFDIANPASTLTPLSTNFTIQTADKSVVTTPPVATTTPKLVSAGGNIWVNLAIATAFSAGVSYFLLRRRHELV